VHPISYLQAIILGLTRESRAVSDLQPRPQRPASPAVRWDIHQNDKYFLTFLIATHLATAIVLLLFFLKDWIEIIKGIFRSLRMREIRQDDSYARLGWLLIAATIPVGVIASCSRNRCANSSRPRRSQPCS